MDINAILSVTGAPELVSKLRESMAALIRDVASKEPDPRVAQRLLEISYAFVQDISHAEAVARMAVAPEHTGLPKVGRPAPPRTSLDAVGTTGGKATTETLKP